jgi:FtsP/CotA-like multicopper oxidase with cupredoxin domain
VVFGDGEPAAAYVHDLPAFDFTTYGAPDPNRLSLNSAFSVQYDMPLDNQLGFFNGGFTMRFLIGGQTYPHIPSLKVNLGDVVKMHIVDNGPIPHVMHLHGHTFTVLAHNGRPLSGSPVQVDSLPVTQGESFDVAFVANNPGLWMLHCHFLAHDAQGMDMMLVYPNIATPYTVGPSSGNNPF